MSCAHQPQTNICKQIIAINARGVFFIGLYLHLPALLSCIAPSHHDRVIADNTLKPLIEELMLFPTRTAYRSLRSCDLELELSHANKGVESIQFYDGGEQGMLVQLGCIRLSLHTFCAYHGTS